MPGALYVVSTPIGNLGDITLRALDVLKSVSLVAAEDTRRTGQLLRHFGIGTQTISLHEHNEEERAPRLLDTLAEGRDIALVSDAGTPVISDPGRRFIAHALSQGIRVVPVPGASAVMAALAISGLPADAFLFAGFAPSRRRDAWFKELSQEARTLVFFEAPHRIADAQAQLHRYFGERPIVVTRELTKIHEEVIRAPASGLNDLAVPPKGEFTIVVGLAEAPPQRDDVSDAELLRLFDQLLPGASSRRAAISATARQLGLPSRTVYARIERLKSLPSS